MKAKIETTTPGRDSPILSPFVPQVVAIIYPNVESNCNLIDEL